MTRIGRMHEQETRGFATRDSTRLTPKKQLPVYPFNPT